MSRLTKKNCFVGLSPTAVINSLEWIAAVGVYLCFFSLLAACSPRVATSFWRIGTEADSVRPGYAVLHEGSKVRHCYPVTEWVDTINHQSQITNHKSNDTYHSFHHHGVAVESELMAYRLYFDKKQTVDVYCKRTPQLELAQSYWYPNDSLLAAGYGDDILRVSGTVGVGSVKYWNGKLCHFDKVASRSQRIVRQTKNSATIEIFDKGLEITNLKSQISNIIDLSVRYTLRANDRAMRCDVSCSAPIDGLCTGVQTIPAKAPNHQSQITNYQLENGVLLVSWGTDWPVNDTVKYAKETVGLGVFIPKEFAGELVHDKSNNLCLLNLTGTESAGLTAKRSNSAAIQQPEGRSEMCHAHFYLTTVGATKENHPVATTAEEWLNYLRKWAKGLK